MHCLAKRTACCAALLVEQLNMKSNFHCLLWGTWGTRGARCDLFAAAFLISKQSQKANLHAKQQQQQRRSVAAATFCGTLCDLCSQRISHSLKLSLVAGALSTVPRLLHFPHLFNFPPEGNILLQFACCSPAICMHNDSAHC